MKAINSRAARSGRVGRGLGLAMLLWAGGLGGVGVTTAETFPQQRSPPAGPGVTRPMVPSGYAPSRPTSPPVYVSYYVPVPVPVPVFPAYGPAGSFNNSYPTYINGRALYSGYYAAGAIFPAYETVGSFNNSYPTYVNGRVVYSGYYATGY